jgi:hypothetical protein
MEPTQGEPAPGEPLTMAPRKRRRRRLIVAFVLVLVSVGTWWQWPRGDARFVGKWMVTDEVDGSNLYPVMFWANGSGYAVTPNGRRHYFSWTVEDGVLRWGSDQPQWIPEWIWSRFVRLRREVTGIAFFPFEWTRRIVSVDRDEIRVLSTSRPQRQLLRRIPE